MDMVERVAIALSLADPDERGLPDGQEMAPFYRGLARAAIAAMREPTEGMIEAAKDARHSVRDGSPHGVVFNHAWMAMIDAALK